MKLLVETGLVDHHGVDGLVDVVEHVDGDVVDERVVVVLVEDHKVFAEDHDVVAEDHKVVAEDHEVVAEVDEKARRLFFISLWQDVCVGFGVAVSDAHCYAPLAPDLVAIA